MGVYERLELVRSFDELHVGLLVVVSPCWCGERHRGILLSPRRGWTDSDPRGRLMYPIEPTPSCTRGRGMCIDDGAVERRQVCRIIDADQVSTGKETERELAST